MNKYIHLTLIIYLLITTLYSCQKTEKNDIQIENRIEDAIKIGIYDQVKALEILDSLGNPDQLSKRNQYLYHIAYLRGKVNRENIGNDSLIFNAIDYFEKQKDYKYAGLANYYAALVYRNRNRPEKDIEYSRLALPYILMTKDSIMISRVLFNIAHIFCRQEYTDSASFYYKEALSQYTIDNKETMRIYRSFASNYYAEDNKISALYNLKKAYNLAIKYNDKNEIKLLIQFFGIIHSDLKNKDLSAKYFHKYLSLIDYKSDTVRTYLNLAKLYIKTGERDSMDFYVDKAIPRLNDIDFNYTYLSTYNTLMQYYALKKDLPNFEKYQKLYDETALTIRTENNRYNVMDANIKALHQIEKKNLAQNNKYTIAYIVSILILILVCCTIFLHRHYKRKEEESKKRSSKEDISY